MTRCPNDTNRAFMTVCGLQLCPDCNFSHLSMCEQCLDDYKASMLQDIWEDLP